MAAQVTPSKLLARMGAALVTSHQKHKSEEPPTPNMDLPGGIKGGVAQVRKVWFGEFKDGKHKGQPFFMAQASVVSPKIYDGVPVAGLFTRIGPEPLCATPEKTGERSRKTFDDHYQWVLGQLKLLAGKAAVEAIGGTPEQIDAGLQNLMALIGKQKPFIAFETREGARQTTGPYAGKPPMVFHEWGGVVTFTQNGDATQLPGVNDTTAAAEAAPEPDANPEGIGEATDDSGDASANEYEGLAEACEAADDAAIARLWAAWDGAGHSEDEAAKLSFAEMVDRLRTPAEEPAAEEPAPEPEPEPEPWKPVAKGTCLWVDPKGKPDPRSKKIKPVSCQITAIDAKGFATLKNLVTNKPVAVKVKVADLLPPE